MKIKSLPKQERPVEKCLSQGVESLSNSELLALIINSGTRDKSAFDLAEEVLAKDVRGICFLRDASPEELMSVSGIGRTKAARLAAAAELGKRISLKPLEPDMHIKDDQDVAALLMEDMRHQKREIFKAVLLNSKGGVISVETVSVGQLNSTMVHPREVFSAAVRRSAAAVVFAHNHPSGDPTPSREDYATTERLVECGRLLGITVADHLIIGDGRYMSLRAMEKI